MKTKKTVDEIIKELWSSKQITEIAEIVRLNESSIRRRAKKLGLKKKSDMAKEEVVEVTPEQEIQEFKEKNRSLKDKRITDQALKTLIEKNDKLEAELNASLEMKNAINPQVFDYKVSDSKSEATAVVLASDFHLEETVRPETVNNLNKFDLKIAEARVKEFFQNTLKLVEKEQFSTRIDTLVLALLGDFISGNIHEELLENCSLRPIDASIFAENLLISGIEYLLANSELNLVIPCHVGNHTRITKKVHISTEKGNSLETFMYYHMMNHFKGNARVKFLISDSYLSYVTIYNYTICFQHGHAIKYGGGVGGITIPARKAVSQWQKLRNADLYCFGHFHTFFDGGNFICNGSLIGYNTFAVFIKGDFETPRQAFFLIDKKRGCKTVTTPILFSV